MGENLTTFEVIVEVEKGGHWGVQFPANNPRAKKSVYIKETLREMFHIRRRTHRQAKRAASKYGKVIKCQKANVEAMLGYPEKLDLTEPSVYGYNPYRTAVAMDEMVWLKRNKRRDNMKRDKTPLTND